MKMTTDEEFLGRWFSQVTKPQLARYNQRMSDAAPYRGAPKWERMRLAAQTEFHDSVAEARELYQIAMAEIIADGEVSEATDYLLTQFKVAHIVQQAAE
jgi:hypothetical protein